VLSKVVVTGDKCFVGGKNVDINSCNAVMQKLSQKQSDRRKSIILEIDTETPMKEVDKIKHALRLSNLLKIGYAAEAEKSVDVKGGSTAIVNLLPPKDAKMLSKEEAFFEGIKMFTISSDSNLKNTSRRLRDHIEDSKKYVILYEYNNTTSYNDYIQTLDMIYSTVWTLRREHAFSKGIDYDKMTKEQEMKLRKKYPLTLTMKNIDSDN
jgi:biopolymer transport protein ExbD